MKYTIGGIALIVALLLYAFLKSPSTVGTPVVTAAPTTGTGETDSASTIAGFVDKGPLTVSQQADDGNVLAWIAQSDAARVGRLDKLAGSFV